ncbi:MAG TPA: ferrous iron transport protein B, partial [Lachnospiraceae bacterium]|nr:ferrous iron transport protein B [Lachnospiraceae bacterium]
GFGCTVPAVMASRVLENRADRMKTILITPFMSCSARLPVYVLFSSLFFGDKAMIAAFSMYVLGLCVAILAAYVMKLLDKEKESSMLLIELPEYKTPNAHTIRVYVWEKVKDYLSKAGTTIFLASIVMWVVMNVGPHGFTADMDASFGAIIGKILVPFFTPIGLGYWQIVLALISGIAAKEVVVSSCTVLFGIGNVTTRAGMSSLSALLESMGFGALNAYVLMVFCLLYVPCMAAVATIRRETGSWKWTGAMAVFQIATAWVVSFVIFQIGGLF